MCSFNNDERHSIKQGRKENVTICTSISDTLNETTR